MHAPKAFGEEVIGLGSDMLHQHPMFVTYIIYSVKLDRYYIGYTSDLVKRLAEHNSGISHFTSKANGWVLKILYAL